MIALAWLAGMHSSLFSLVVIAHLRFVYAALSDMFMLGLESLHAFSCLVLSCRFNFLLMADGWQVLPLIRLSSSGMAQMAPLLPTLGAMLAQYIR